MHTTVNMYDFERAFRALRPDNFSYGGLKALFEYFEEYEDSLGEEIELDVIAICCDFSEYENIAEVTDDYNSIMSLEGLQENTTVIEIPDTEGLIVASF